MRRSASPRLVAPHTKGTVKGHLSMWYASSAGVSTSDSSMKSTPSDCSTWASAKCPMRALAITGMVTASMIPSISSGSLIRATPPSRRMSAGTRSSAMTDTAPASSAILACSALTTSMMTPPRSMSANPRLTVKVPVVMRSSLRGWPAAPSHHSLSAAALTDVASRSPGTQRVVPVPDGRVDPDPAGRPEAGRARRRTSPSAGAGAAIIVRVRRAGRAGSARPTRPRRRPGTPGSPRRSAAASSRRRGAWPA